MITFRGLNENEKNILVKEITYWLSNDLAKKFLENKYFIIGEGKWREIFLVNKETYDLFTTESLLPPYSIGLGFGEFKGNNLLLGLGGLYLLSEITKKKITISEDAEQLFLYSRNIFGDSIIECTGSYEKGVKVLVVNQKKDVLGIGKFEIDSDEIKNPENKQREIVKNLIDLGWYLRKGK
ncbi:MAG: PUA domain-containing protein [Candidatus Thorarchaeota archaeon]